MIRLENVTFGYDEGQTVLKDYSLKINQGEFVTILGHNGSEFIRYYGKVIFDEDEDKSLLKKAFEKMPMLEKTYGADSDLKPAIFHISKATAEIRNAAGIIESYDFLD